MFFLFQMIPCEGVFYMLYQKKSKNRYFLDTFTHGGSILINENLKALQLLLSSENTCNTQTIEGKD